MPKRLIKVRFQNGLSFNTFKKDVFDLAGLDALYQFEESANPDFIIFGPYGNDIPKKGNYTRVGYFCENVTPDFSSCEWAFGIPHESEFNRENYSRIQWHGTNPNTLVKPEYFNAENILASKTRFCNFLYSHKVPYREAFFTQLSKYKKIDSPGKSMNNMPGLDDTNTADIFNVKRTFLTQYKFTIAFESYVYPGYQTEKLYDAMLVNSVPIYCGDPLVANIFNTSSFINAADYIKTNNQAWIKWLEKNCQPNFVDIRPSFYNNPMQRARRKFKSIGKQVKMKCQFQNLDFSPLIERVIELDTDDNKYIEVLKKQWLNNAHEPQTLTSRNYWIKIFNSLVQ